MAGLPAIAITIFDMDIIRRFDRLLQLFFILQSKSVVTIEELEKRFEISRRTIYRDLKALETAGVPICNEFGTGYAIMEGYRIQPSRFTQEEILSLTIAEKIMQQHETRFVRKHFEEALIKIKGSFQLYQKNILVDLQDKLHVSEGLSAAAYLPDVINILLQASVSKLKVTLSYLKSSETTVNEREVEPLGLFYESGFWYLFALCHLRKDYRNFRLDRIRKVTLSEQGFEIEHLPVDKLRNQQAPENTVKITIRAERSLAHYLFWERQNFGFVQEELSGNELIMHFECAAHPTSFVRWMMKFVDFTEIIEPVQLKQELSQILKAGLRKIDTDQSKK